MSEPEQELGVYVHFPWCLEKCPYCDFATRKIERDSIPHQAYAQAICDELAWRHHAVKEHRLKSIFFGGGTPSLWQAEAIAKVVQAIKTHFPKHVESIEVTLECNPSSLNDNPLDALRDAGINRISLGIQSLHDDALRYLGRWHNAAQALRALTQALQCMPRVSADLMFGMPSQRLQQWQDDLKQLADTGIEHLSLYALTIESNTPFGERFRKGRLPIAGEESYAEMFALSRPILSPYGFDHYEVSNFAKPQQQSAHNAHYWRGGDYLGLGAAAVGCVANHQTRQARRWRNRPVPHDYIAKAHTPEVEHEQETLDASTRVREAMMLGLRSAQGVDLHALQERTGRDPLHGRERAIATQCERGNLSHEGPILRVPQARWLHLDGIITALF